MSSNKKNDDAIDVEEENSFEFSTQETEVPVTKPGPLEKRERRSKGSNSESRAVTSADKEYFDIE